MGFAVRPRFIERLELPFRARHDPGRFTGKVDAGPRAEAEIASVLVDRLRPNASAPGVRFAAAQRVEVDVAGVREAVDEIERTVRTPVVEIEATDIQDVRRHV